nr:MAG TPA: Histone acetyltransferase [Bacteriophage sp.]
MNLKEYKASAYKIGKLWGFKLSRIDEWVDNDKITINS